jgi:putative transposase
MPRNNPVRGSVSFARREASNMLRKSSHKVGLSVWHLVWATKYRYKMMRKLENKNLVAAAVRKAAFEHGVEVLVLAVQEDHVHVLVRLPRQMTDSRAFMLLKGRSAYLIFRNKEKYRLRYPKGHFWSPGGCAVTVGQSDFETTARYIQNQEVHHAQATA